MLTEGDITFGWVIEQINRPGIFTAPSHGDIMYEFKASSGQLIQGKFEDETASFYEEMIIPVFYDPQNPHDNTVITDLDEIVLTEGKHETERER